MLNFAPAGSISSRQSVRAPSFKAMLSTGMKDSVGASRSSTSTGRVPCDEFAGVAAEGTNNTGNKASVFSLTRTTSRLFAPTASSLARMRSPTALKSNPSHSSDP